MKLKSFSIDGFENIEYLSAGGMGVVYSARRCFDSQIVAIKVVKGLSESKSPVELIKRFNREVDMSVSLSHNHIVKTFSHGKLLSGEPYVVMEYLDGRSLGEEVVAEGPISIKQSLVCLQEIGLALQYCHNLGLIHRDIKPDNIFMDIKGRCLLLDFGLAVDDDSTKLTETGQVLGSFLYMSPEQMADCKTSASGDIYSLGVSIFYSLTGRHPYSQDEIIRIYTGQNLDVPMLSSIDPSISVALSRVVAKCMSPSIELRYGSASDLLKDLQLLKEGKEISLPSFTEDKSLIQFGGKPSVQAGDKVSRQPGDKVSRQPGGETGAHIPIGKPDSKKTSGKESRQIPVNACLKSTSSPGRGTDRVSFAVWRRTLILGALIFVGCSLFFLAHSNSIFVNPYEGGDSNLTSPGSVRGAMSDMEADISTFREDITADFLSAGSMSDQSIDALGQLLLEAGYNKRLNLKSDIEPALAALMYLGKWCEASVLKAENEIALDFFFTLLLQIESMSFMATERDEFLVSIGKLVAKHERFEEEDAVLGAWWPDEEDTYMKLAGARTIVMAVNRKFIVERRNHRHKEFKPNDPRLLSIASFSKLIVASEELEQMPSAFNVYGKAVELMADYDQFGQYLAIVDGSGAKPYVETIDWPLVHFLAGRVCCTLAERAKEAGKDPEYVNYLSRARDYLKAGIAFSDRQAKYNYKMDNIFRLNNVLVSLKSYHDLQSYLNELSVVGLKRKDTYIVQLYKAQVAMYLSDFDTAERILKENIVYVKEWTPLLLRYNNYLASLDTLKRKIDPVR